jgi:chemotaxis protein methyltransferase CheR
LLPSQFDRLRALIEEHCGLHLDESRRAALAAAVRTRMQHLGAPEIDDYGDHLERRSADAEFRKLIALLTVTSTCFFRDPAQFRLLRRYIVPALMAARAADGRRALRFWSAGCSSGEEAYSIALTLWDMGFYAIHSDWTFEIVGTDLNTDVLDTARGGLYSARSLRNLEGDWLRRYFTPQGDLFRLNDDIRRCVRFEYGNLTQPGTLESKAATRDVVFCKNVTIYFKPAMTRRLVRGLHCVLVDGGYLLLGHSETLWQMDEGFSLVGHEGAFCYQKAPPSAGTGVAGSAPATSARFGPRRSVRPARGSCVPSGGQGPSRPDDSAGRYEECLAAFRAGDWPRAEQRLRDLIRSSPTFAPAHLLLGGVYLRRSRYEEAGSAAGEVLRVNDLEARAHLLLGIIAARSGRPDDAVQALRRTLYLDDSLALAHFWLGNLHRDRGDLNRACREYENILHRWERRTLDLTEEFALDMTAQQLVEYCQQSVARLQPAGS